VKFPFSFFICLVEKEITMKNNAPVHFPIHPMLEERWSTRAFSDEKVSRETLQRLFEAARWAPSSMNQQPWRFIIGCDKDESWRKIVSTLVEFNQLWAQYAPVLILTVGRKILEAREDKNTHYQYDIGQAVAYFTFQAQAENLFVHQMGGVDFEKASEVFEIEEPFTPISVLAVGYYGNPERLHENIQKMENAPRQRNPASDFVFEGKFGNKSKLF
jgi:nitroreductase